MGLLARSGDREALRALGALGGKRAHERRAERKAAVAAEVHLGTVAEMRSFITRLAGELEASMLDAARKSTAGASLIRALAELDQHGEIIKERDALRAEVAMLRALGTGDRTVKLQWSDDDETPATGPSPGASDANPAGNAGVSE